MTEIMPGLIIGRLHVLKETSRDRWGNRRFECRCECGQIREIRGTVLKRGESRSCGCLHRDNLRRRVTRHGHSRNNQTTPTYRSWRNMLDRCFSESSPNYKYYGARGIKVCQRWKSFENFIADMGERPVGMFLDRVDNDGNYEPGNCRWSTARSQACNRRNTVTVVVDGVDRPLIEVCRERGLNYNAAHRRLRRGFDPLFTGA